jgi:sugar O-acyltransferase (sialic acid O-acetyltransferase NeuD family)
VRDLVIVGAGGHGREVFDAVSALNSASPTWRVLGFVDDAPEHPERVGRLGAELLGTLDWLLEHPTTYALGIGTSAARRTVAERFDAAGLEPATVVHPAAHLGLDVRLGAGVVIYNGATVTTNVSIGRHTHLNVGCAVQHDTVLGDFVQLSPGVYVNGDCTVGDGAFLGTGAIVTRGTQIGADARVGAGAVVLDDVPAGATALGVPARMRD